MDPAWTRLTRAPRWKDPNAHGASTRAVDPWNSAGTWPNGRLSVDNPPAMAMAQWQWHKSLAKWLSNNVKFLA
jgi:hypothetical protein